MLIEPQNLSEFRSALEDLIDDGFFDHEWPRDLVQDCLDEICLVIELRETPSPSQRVIGMGFIKALEAAHGQDGQDSEG